MNISKAAIVLTEIQGDSWGITIASGNTVSALETQAELDARSDAFHERGMRYVRRAEQVALTDPAQAVECMRLALIDLMNSKILDDKEDDCREKAIGHVDTIRSLARRCSDWVKVIVGGNQPSQAGRKLGPRKTTRAQLGGAK